MSLPIHFSGTQPLVHQLEARIRELIETAYLRPGIQIPSVRQLASDLSISTFTVVTAYERLMAADYLFSRRAKGYFVAERRLDHLDDPDLRDGEAIDTLWLFRSLRGRDENTVKAGAGVLPPEWIDSAEIQRCARAALRQSGKALAEYPSVLGHRPLRDLLALKLIDQGISVQANQVVLTAGASHALDLVLRTVIEPGGMLLVEDPGYYTLFEQLKLQGIPFVGIPREPVGLNLEALENAARRHRPRALFVNLLLHNPTGGTLSTNNAHNVLAIAERHGMLIIEDDIYGDFYEGRAFRLANLDQLERVIYISSFAKTISASLRVGFVAASAEQARRIAAKKLATCLATSDLNERIIAELMGSGVYRRQMERTRQRLDALRPRVIARLRALGLGVATEPEGGFFLWASMNDGRCSRELAKVALTHGLVLAPGQVFSPEDRHSTLLRFNVAHCDSELFTQRMTAAMAALRSPRNDRPRVPGAIAASRGSDLK